LRLTSTRPIDDPFLDIIIELQWATGRLVREYTFLLDPPQFRERAPAAAAPAPSAPQVAKPAPVPAPAAPEARPLAPRPGAAATSTSGGTYAVRKGDTLGKIARENKPDGVSLQQMLVALYRANQGAFIRSNMNLVREGRILQIPDRDAAAGISSTEASGVVRQHMSDFSDYRAKVGAAVAAKPAAAAPGREVTGRIAAKPEAPAPGAQRDQLKLSKADPAKPSQAAGARRARGRQGVFGSCVEGIAIARHGSGEERRRPAEAAGDEEQAARATGTAGEAGCRGCSEGRAQARCGGAETRARA
jgi:pilus assembly protein FimV